MKARALAAVAAVLLIAACSGPTTPRTPALAGLPAQVTAAIVTCTTCTAGPTMWVSATATVSVTNLKDSALEVETVEARVLNVTRNAVLGTNVRPNTEFVFPDTTVPAKGTLTLEAGLTFHPLPPPTDQLRLIVVVTFRGGASAQTEAPLVIQAG